MTAPTRRITRRPGRMLNDQKRNDARRRASGLYNRGQSIRQIGGQLGLSYGMVHRLLQEADVTFRPRGGVPGPRRK